MRLADLVQPEQVVANLRSKGKFEVLSELANLLALNHVSIPAEEFCRLLVERERLRSTGVGSGVAIPHGKVPGLTNLTLAVGLSKIGIDFDAADGKPVHVFMALAAPVSSTGDHLKALARIARLCNDSGFQKKILLCETDQEAYSTLIEEDEKHSF